MNDFLKFDNWFKDKYGGKIPDRYHTFRAALNLFLQRRGELIVETGCQREEDDWGAGASTSIFGEFCARELGKLVSADNNEEHIERCRKFIEPFSLLVSLKLSDSVEFLQKFDQRIDLLYLDSMDHPLPPKDYSTMTNGEKEKYQKDCLPCQEHALKEIKAAWEKLHRDSIILLDDCNFPTGGKCKLAIDFLVERQWRVVLLERQCLLIT